MDLTQQIEKRIRTYRTFLRKQSYQAYLIERRIDKEMKKVVENLKPPYQKPKRTSPLPRYHLKRRETAIPVKPKLITERAKFLFRAFHEGELTDETFELKDSFIQVGAEQEQIVPFYFDHFLKINGYTPNYNFKTHIEMRDGPEIDRLQIKSVIPDVLEHMEYWQNLKRKIMEENIARNPKIYVNVVT